MIQKELAPLIHEAIVAAQQAGDLPPFDVPPATAIPIARLRLEEHGDFATPIALQLAGRAHRKPRPLAKAIVTHLPVGPAHMLASAEVASPGFVNLRLAVPWLVRHVDRVLTAGAHYADPSVGAGRTALVEFVSVNPTGPLTVGHGRGAVIGDTLGNLLEAGGFAVTREYCFNDAGLQMKNLAESVRLRARQLLGESIDFPADYYVGDYITEVARDLLAQYGPAAVDHEWTVLRDHAIALVFADIRKSFERLDVRFDLYFNEMRLYDKSRPDSVWDVLAALRERGLAYEAQGAAWFKATAFDADKDCVLVRSTGEPTYRPSA